MSDLLTIPMQDDYETTLSSTWNGAVWTMSVNTTPAGTIPVGKYSYIVVNPWEANMQVAKISWWDSGAKTITVSDVAVPKSQAGNYSAVSHAAGATVRFSNNYAFWIDILNTINSKADTSALNAKVWDFAFTASKVETPAPMTFSDNETAEVTLKQLATGNGADQYVAVSPNDTEVGHLNAKVSVWSGLTKSITNPWANEVLNITPDLNVLASKEYVDDNAFGVLDSDYPLWESITDITKSCVFKETAPTFATSTSLANIWDIILNTRVSFPAIGNWTSSNYLRLALAKVLSPTAFLRVRIETDNAGSPSGTLVDANATKDIDPATLTTSLTDTTVTFPWSFIIANWTKVHIIVSAVWDVVNSSNYYKIWYSSNNTTTRTLYSYNWSSYVLNAWFSEPRGVSWASTDSQTANMWYRILAKKNLYIKTVTKNALCTATTAYIRNDWWTILATATFVWNVATFTPYTVASWTYLRITVDSGWSNWTRNYTNTSWIQTIWLNFDYVSTFDWSNYVNTRYWVIESIWWDFEWFPYIFSNVWTTNNTLTISNALNTTTTSWSKYWQRIYANVNCTLWVVTKSSTCTAAKAYLKSDAWAVLSTVTFVWNIATFSYSLVAWTYYRIECGSDGSAYTVHYVAWTFPQNSYDINIISWSIDWADGSAVTLHSNIETIQTLTTYSSWLFHNTVLSLTDSDFAYKTSLYWISTDLASIGAYPKLTVFWASDNFTGMTEWGTQYLWPTPWGIQSTAGTNSFIVWKARNSTKLRVKDLIS